MFAKKNRFTFKTRLPRNTIQSESFSIRFERNDIEKLQVAVVVSKKVDKRATVRNRIKRLILEAVQKNIDTNQGLTLVFYAKAAASSTNLGKEVADVVNKLTENKHD